MNGEATRHFVRRLTVIAVISVLLALVDASARGESVEMSGRLLLTGSSTMAHDFVSYLD